MSELTSILEAADSLERHCTPYYIATVVCVEGSSYRKPGARMLLTGDRWIAGSVSGGCLERDVVKKSEWLTQQGEARLVTYDASDPEEVGSLLGCQGVVHVLVEKAGNTADPILFMRRCVDRQSRGAIVTVFRSESASVMSGARLLFDGEGFSQSIGLTPLLEQRFASAAEACLASGSSTIVRYEEEGTTVEALVEAVIPPLRLFIFGAGHDAIPVASLARTMGWEVIVHQMSPRPGTRERFGADVELTSGPLGPIVERIDESYRAAVITMSHDIASDRISLSAALSSNAFYIGALGPLKRTASLLGDQPARMGDRESGLNDPRLHAPVGLSIGAETPSEIALSIVSEIQAKLADTRGNSLRGTAGPIHACAAE